MFNHMAMSLIFFIIIIINIGIRIYLHLPRLILKILKLPII
jgi:hypothetical protein